MIFVRRIWNRCKRFRHRCGYGVHSPSDFFLITSVVYEKLPYYAYSQLKETSFPKALPHYREKVNRLLFRLVNHYQPKTLIEVGKGNGAAMKYMCAARPALSSTSLEGMEMEQTLHQLKAALEKMNRVDFLHIGATPYYIETFEAAYPYLHEQSCMVVGHLYDSDARAAWWKFLQHDERVRLTFDLYDIGIVLFDKNRYKQNYVVNFL